MPQYTLLKDTNDKSLASIEWKDHPLVEVRGALPKQRVRDWLTSVSFLHNVFVPTIPSLDADV